MPQSPTQLTRRSLSDQAADALVEYIVAEDLKEGDSLPSTAELSERFGVSRTVIREALAALAGRGVLARSQGRESVVATPGGADLTRLLQFTARRDQVTLADILDARYGLEITAAQLAASRANEEDLSEIQNDLAALESAKKDAEFNLADVALHRAIAEASANPLIVLMLDGLADFLLDFRVKSVISWRRRGESMGPIVEEHRKIVDAIAAGDPGRAAAAMQEHLDASRSRID